MAAARPDEASRCKCKRGEETLDLELQLGRSASEARGEQPELHGLDTWSDGIRGDMTVCTCGCLDGCSGSLALALSAARLHDPTGLTARCWRRSARSSASPPRAPCRSIATAIASALGAVVRADGYIVTKASELKGKIECQLPGRRQNEKLEATIVASDPALDLAILKIDAKDLPPIAWSRAVAGRGKLAGDSRLDAATIRCRSAS